MAPITRSFHKWTVLIIGIVLLLRVIALIASPLGLHGDEAQYWAWSKSLDWGYFTKPPMIAWIIFATTSVFGDAEWAVRISSPLIHAATAYVIFRSARFAFDPKTGFWAAMIYLLMPAVWLSSSIVSTDVALLLFWALALNAWLHLRVRATWPRAIQLGVAIGLGLLSKYAMLFFLPALAFAIWSDPPTRRALLSRKGLFTTVLATALIMPNIVWNMNNDFATVSHTAANANMGDGPSFHPLELITFWIDQFGVFGPITFGLLIAALIVTVRMRDTGVKLMIAAFILSPLLIISLEALLSRANANWAVTAYVGASLLLAAVSVSAWDKWGRWVSWGVITQTVISIIIGVILLMPDWTDALGLSNSVKRLRGWPQTVAAIEAQFDKGHDNQSYGAIAFDKRITLYGASYYGLGNKAPIKMWARHTKPQHHADFSKALGADIDGAIRPTLLVNYNNKNIEDSREDYIPFFEADFTRLEPLPPINIDLGGGKTRTLYLWAAYGYTPTKTR